MPNADTITISQTFDELKKKILTLDPVSFCEHYLTVDGRPLKLDGTGWYFLSDIYRHIALSAIKPDAKPVVIVKGRQVGASTMAVALAMYFCAGEVFGTSPDNPPMRVLHCFPSLPNVNKFSKEKLSTMMRTSKDDYIKKHSLRIDEKTGKVRSDVPEDTLMEKLFRDENKLWVDSNGNLASRLQGLTLDTIFHDEVQRMREDDIANDLRTLSQAQHGPVGKGVQLYFGTPLTKGSYFWKLWNASDQRYFHLGCVECGHYFMLYTPGSDAWEKIWIQGNMVECPQCSHRQDKNEAVQNGKWIITRGKSKTGYEPQYTGFHINQFQIPTFTKEVIQSENPKYNPTKSERIWITDILGEFYSGSALPITEEEIYRNCKDDQRSISSGIPVGRDISTFMGIDWGQKTDDPNSAGQSYSTVVIASVGKSGIFRIENAFKMKKTDIKYKKSVVAEMYRRFGIKITVADVGWGNDIVPDLQRDYQSRFWGCMNSGTLVKPIKLLEDSLTIVCNRDLLLDDIFNMFRRGKITFPLKDSRSYECMSTVIEHCSSMEKTTRTVQGNVVNKYEKGNTENDFLMSIMYSIIAYRFYITRGFKVKQHRIGKTNNKPVLAYVPRL
jgi:hypothetical protein